MLEDGKQYRDGWGAVYTVEGPTKKNPEWVWTTQGKWYRRSDGRQILYDREKGSHPCDRRTNYDLHPCTHNEPIESADKLKYIPVCRVCGHVSHEEDL